jgi:hypothetical protein
MSWWSNLNPTERALMVGGGFAAASAILVGVAVGGRLRKGVPIQVEIGPQTRNLVANQVSQVQGVVNQLSEKGVPVYVLLGAKDISERRDDEPQKRRRDDEPKKRR